MSTGAAYKAKVLEPASGTVVEESSWFDGSAAEFWAYRLAMSTTGACPALMQRNRSNQRPRSAPSCGVDTIIGAVIALVGVGLTQLVQTRRDDRRWLRETEQQSLNRFYDHRREAHVDFMREFERLRLAIWNYDSFLSPGPDPSDIEDLFEPLYQRLTVVRIFGSDEAYNAAADAMGALTTWTSKGRKEDDPLNTAFDAYVDCARTDLGVK